MDDVRRRVKVELARCRNNIALGGSPKFWLWRLRLALAPLESGAQAVRECIAWLEQLEQLKAAPSDVGAKDGGG